MGEPEIKRQLGAETPRPDNEQDAGLPIKKPKPVGMGLSIPEEKAVDLLLIAQTFEGFYHPKVIGV
jgi:hypothetical protein